MPTTPTTDQPRWRNDPAPALHPDTVALAGAAIAALRPDQRTRIDELGLRRLERAAHPLVGGWTPTDLARSVSP